MKSHFTKSTIYFTNLNTSFVPYISNVSNDDILLKCFF